MKISRRRRNLIKKNATLCASRKEKKIIENFVINILQRDFEIESD